MSDDGFKRQVWEQPRSQTDLPAPVATLEVMMWLIVAEPQEQRGAILQITPGAIIGRRGDLRWPDPRMSRQHAQFRVVAHPRDRSRHTYALEPINDRNGTWLNGERLTRSVPLVENDVLLMGDTYFVVKVLE